VLAVSFYRLLGAAVAQLFLIFLIITPELITRMTGREITLKVSKAFPDDSFVRSCLNLEFELWDNDSLKTEIGYISLYLDQKVFIPLQQKEEVWVLKKDFQIEKPEEEEEEEDGVPKRSFQIEKPKGEVFVTAKVSCWTYSTKDCRRGKKFIFDFENYFVPDWAVKEWFSLKDKDVKAKLLVDKSGHAVLVKLIVNGSPWP